MSTAKFSLADDFPAVGYDQWRSLVEKDLDGAPFDKKLTTRLYEGVTLQPLYTEADWTPAGDPSGFPGEQPFVRGSEALRRGWEIRQSFAHPDPAITNHEILADLEHGVNGVALRLARATGNGKSSHSENGHEGDHDGVVIATIDDLSAALEGVQPDAAPVALEAGAEFLPAAALLAALWRSQGAEKTARGSLGADPLGGLAGEGSAAGGSAEVSLAQMGALAAWAAKKLPGVTTAHVSTAPYHDAGASAVQDLAYGLATGVAYLRALTAAGLSIDAACGQITFGFSIGTHFFKEIARLRAARRLWARVTEVCGAAAGARAMRIGAVSASNARRSMTQRDPWVNMLRATSSCFAAAVGGAESITVLPFDARLGLPDEHSRRLARNTQIILQEESHIARVIDPAGGCWFIEKLTDQLAEAAWKLFQQIEALGGMEKALTSGWIAAQLDATWNERLKNLARRKDAVTGVSEFPNMKEKLPERAAPDVVTLKEKATRHAAARASDPKLKTALTKLAKQQDPQDPQHPMDAKQIEALVKVAGSGASIAAMLEALNTPVHTIMTPLPLRPLAGPFEELRDASDECLIHNGARPSVYLVNLGPLAHHTARATWSQNFFEAGGFEVFSSKPFDDAGAAAEAWKASHAPIAVICSSDKMYGEHAADTARALKTAGAKTVVLAGHPGENREAWSAAGIDLYIHIGCDVHGILASLLKQEGALA